MDAPSSTSYGIAALMMSAGVVVGAAFLVAVVLRWMLRINHICKRLDQLAAAQGYTDAQNNLHVNARKRMDPKDVRIPVN